MQVAERAKYAKKLLLECSDVFKDRISLAVFGESKPLYSPKKGESIDRNNPNLRQKIAELKYEYICHRLMCYFTPVAMALTMERSPSS